MFYVVKLPLAAHGTDCHGAPDLIIETASHGRCRMDDLLSQIIWSESANRSCTKNTAHHVSCRCKKGPERRKRPCFWQEQER